MAEVLIIDPVTRLEGHLKIKVAVENGRVVDAHATGTLFRGFENILVNRPPQDASHITQRICGVCPVSHGMAAVLALDAASKVSIPTNALFMRNLVLGSNFLQSHILHFYHLALQDFVDGPAAMAPWQPSWPKEANRLSSMETTRLANNYVAALSIRRQAHEMGALFGGRLPHPPTYISGGFTTTPRGERKIKFKAYLSEITAFIEKTLIPDVDLLMARYPEYLEIGRGPGNLLAYGVFDLDTTGTNKLLKRGQVQVVNGSEKVQPVDINAITEQVTYSWYEDSTNNLKPSDGATKAQYPKDDAYSWLKAPRYAGKPYEVGPLARMWVNGDYREGISVMDRHKARALEALKIARAMPGWVDKLNPTGAVYTKPTIPTSAKAYGLTEAPRGALGHWMSLTNGRIAGYQVVTPTCWNASPRDQNGVLGPIEQSLIGTPVKYNMTPIEVVRVIHSFDPCLSCAVHVMRPGEEGKVFTLDHFHGEEEIYAHDHGDGQMHVHHKQEHDR
jgi:hydrogenase large subunit